MQQTAIFLRKMSVLRMSHSMHLPLSGFQRCRAEGYLFLKAEYSFSNNGTLAIVSIPMSRSRSNANASWRIFLGICCIALIILGGTIHVAHFHAPGDAPDPGCTLCATAHVAISPAAPIVVPVRVPLVAAPVVDLQPARPRRFVVLSLYIRPPPLQVACA